MTVYIAVYQLPPGGQYQLAIEDETSGHRLAGPSFIGTSKLVFRAPIQWHDVAEMKRYLSKVTRPLCGVKEYEPHPGSGGQPPDPPSTCIHPPGHKGRHVNHRGHRWGKAVPSKLDNGQEHAHG